LASEIQIPMARGGEKLLSFSIDPWSKGDTSTTYQNWKMLRARPSWSMQT
jgi:hypothetical protein